MNARRYEEAIDVLENKAIKLDAQHQPALVTVGDAYFMLNKYDKAALAFTAAANNDPLDPTCALQAREDIDSPPKNR